MSENILKLSGRGTVYSFTTISDPDSAPEGFQNQVPYSIALIQLEEGMLITAQITDLDIVDVEKIIDGQRRVVHTHPELKIGLPVEMVTRKLKEDGDERGLIVYGYKFRPVMKTNGHSPERNGS